MIRLALAALLVLSLAVPGIATGQSGDSSGEPQATVAKKKKKASCKKGYVRKQVKVTKGPKKGKRVSKCVKKQGGKKKGGKKKPAAPLVPDDPNSGGVYVGGSGPTELKILVGYGDNNNGIALRLTFPAGSLQCESSANPGQKVPSDQDVRTSYEGKVNRKTGAFSGSETYGEFSRSMSGSFLTGKRIKAQVTLTNIQSGLTSGGKCSGSATRDVTYKPGVAGSFSNP